jgi:CheY-like chemotaxis protein
VSALRVLHVDDEPDIRELVQISLGLDPELAVKSCSSGTDALSAADEWAPDVILMDVMMPVMDGPQTLIHLRERKNTAETPVVFMTARAQARELTHFLSLGAAGVIPKPFDPMTLAGSLRQYVRPIASKLDELKRRFIERAQDDAGKLAGLRARIASDPAAVMERLWGLHIRWRDRPQSMASKRLDRRLRRWS